MQEKAHTKMQKVLREAGLLKNPEPPISEDKERQPLIEQNQLNKEEIESRFRQGIKLFEDGQPPPPNTKAYRIQSAGWRYARRIKHDYDDLLAQLTYAFGDEIW